jgi:hypothetical protein
VWALNSSRLEFRSVDVTAGYGWGDIPSFDLRDCSDIAVDQLTVRIDNFQLKALSIERVHGLTIRGMSLVSGPGGGSPGQVIDATDSTGVRLESVQAALPTPVGAFFGVNSNVTVVDGRLAAAAPWGQWQGNGTLTALNVTPLHVAPEAGAVVEAWGWVRVAVRFAAGGPVGAGLVTAVNGSNIWTAPISNGSTGWVEALLWRNQSALRTEAANYTMTATCNCTAGAAVGLMVEGLALDILVEVSDGQAPALLLAVPLLRTGQPATLDSSTSVDNDGIAMAGWSQASGPAATGLPCAAARCAVTFLVPGQVVLTAFATDHSGNGAVRNITFTVYDATAPNLTVHNLSRPSPRQGEVFSVTVATFDNDPAFVAVVEWTLDGGRIVGDGLSHEFAIEAMGPHLVAARVVDGGGNAASVEVTVVVRDGRAPSLEGWTPPEGLRAGDTVELNGSLALDNVAVVSWSWRVAGPGVDYNLSGASANASLPAEGTYRITLTAADAEGNEGSRNYTVVVGPAPGGGLLPAPGILAGSMVLAAVAAVCRRRERK